jgi:2-dehydro-3-deoxyphosphooctonate aldolase (KDO 8-P synthase)
MKLCGFDAGLEHRFFLIAGTCSIEGLQMSLDVAGQLQEICSALGIPSFTKARSTKQTGLLATPSAVWAWTPV